VPTSRPRHTITESDELARALDDAAHQWPEDRDARAKLLHRLILEGHRAMQAERDTQIERRRRAVRRTSGKLTDVYPANYLEQLRGDWPE
jgi:hypothetical protein